MVLSREEEEIVRWARESFRVPWFTLVDIMKKIHRGEKLNEEDYYFSPYFIPGRVDARIVYKAMKMGFGPRLFFGGNGNLFTIILSKHEDRVIWACFEREEEGVYVDYKVFSIDGDWSLKVAELLWADKLKETFEALQEYVSQFEEFHGIKIGAIKVANIMFFGAIKRAWTESGEGKNFPLFVVKGLSAVEEIMKKRWIRFYPDVPLYKFLRTFHILYSFNPLSNVLSDILSQLFKSKPVEEILSSYSNYALKLVGNTGILKV